MKRKSKKISISRLLSNDEKITEKDVLTLLVLMEKGRIPNPKLLKELNLGGTDLNAPESAGHYRRRLERGGVIKGYPTKVNWKKIGYPTEFVVIMTSDNNELLLEFEKAHLGGLEEYRQQTGACIFVIPLSEKGDKIILKDVVRGGEKPTAIIFGVATGDWAATMFAEFYLPKRYPGADITLLIIQRASIRNFNFQDELIESLIHVLFDEGEIKKYEAIFEKEFRFDLL